jgi:VanZ family protein
VSIIRRCALAAGWLLAAIIAFSTLSPLHLRPKTGHPDLERFAAFFLAGVCFAIAYPRYRRWIALSVVVGAALLEAGQLLVPGRDAHVHDAVVKAAGGLIGVALATLAERQLSRWRG